MVVSGAGASVVGISMAGIDGAVAVGCSVCCELDCSVGVSVGASAGASAAGMSICGRAGGGDDSWLLAHPAKRIANRLKDSNFCILIN